MNLSENTILITGGSTGIGLALAADLLQKGNQVIICARNEAKLAQAQAEYPGLSTYVCDISDEASLKALVTNVLKDHPGLNMLVNNAGAMHLHDVAKGSLPFASQKQEVETNLLGTIALCDAFLPHLQRQPEAAILNVTSGLAYTPYSVAPVYAATKAAVHSYTMSIRLALKKTSVQVFEALPPMVDTGMVAHMEMEGMQKMSTTDLTAAIMKGLAKNKLEIRPGASAVFIRLYKTFPSIFNAIMEKGAPDLRAIALAETAAATAAAGQ